MKKTEYAIGRNATNDIVIDKSECKDHQATVYCDKGSWYIKNLNEINSIHINKMKANNPQKLDRFDKIMICGKTIYWSNYLIEGDDQELYIKDIYSINGRISRANYRSLSLLAIGLLPIIYFLPGLIISLRYGKRSNPTPEQVIEFTQLAASYVHPIGYSILAILFSILTIKRMRDAGNNPWKTLIPFYNLKVLYFKGSKSRL